MSGDAARFAGRWLRVVGTVLAVGSTAGLVALRLVGPTVDASAPLAGLGRGILVASAALALTLFAALGLGLVVAGLAFGLDGADVATREVPVRRGSEEE